MQSSTKQKIVKGITDALFPIYCIGCNNEGTWLCQKCASGISCAPKTMKRSAGSLLVAGFDYKNPSIERLIHLLKYDFIEDIAPILAELLFNFFIEQHLQSLFIVTAVPLHAKKYHARGFNQSHLIAKTFSHYAGIEYIETLTRFYNTKSQTELLREERLTNVAGVFSAHALEYIQQKNIILIDDVLTTGATMQEAATTLLQAGARRVIGLAVAHG